MILRISTLLVLLPMSNMVHAGKANFRCCRVRTRPAFCTPYMTPRVAVYCTGTCKDGDPAAAYGYGDNYGQAQTDANNKIAIQCASPSRGGGVQSYDTCTPACGHHGSGTYAVTESGNPAPGSGEYVEVLVLSTSRTWYYGPYSSYNEAYRVFQSLYNPSTQWTALPQYIAAGTILQPW